MASHRAEEITMSNHTYRVSEIVGTSPDGIDTAISNGIARAAATIRNLDWFEVVSVRGEIEDGAVAHYQVTMKVGFKIEDPEA
ncbi:flavin-binding protein dodecin [Agromyces ramosus]|uniref:Flavin-binding protein dodecin n=2 Tax=Agromyces ramosus TaxID=33879 RepID=A0ABU0R9G0_9MICO|nr:flavin-binding protein dodecin [Agromyces ramosus]